MVDLRNVADRTFGEYGEDGYAAVVTEDAYEKRRFESSAGGRRKARHEMGMVQGFIATLPPEQRVLDAPCGMGRFTEVIRAAGHTPVSVDLNVGMLARALERYGEGNLLIQGNALTLPFPDQAFGAAICFRLLHHLPDNMILAALTELHRVADRALITFYDTRSIKYWRKKLRGKPVSGQYYSAGHMASLVREAGWQSCDHVNPLELHRNLHGMHLA
jgi:SAM-dependent methyltransferase